SMFRGSIGSKEKLFEFLPEEAFDIVEGCDVMVMPRLVMMNGDLQAQTDWFATGVDIIATDWEAF
ncbi:Thoeris anti-defense Tad2 family protein, partial [Escherichia coli]